MPKKDFGEAIISETGNWNVADSYTKVKIMRPLAMCDIYEDVATFGYESFLEELSNLDVSNDLLRYKGLERLIYELIKLIHNTKFALRIVKTRKLVLNYKKQLTLIQNALPRLRSYSFDEVQGSRKFKISSMRDFEGFLNIVSKIKSKINEPLNQNHLIFTDREEFDPVAFKDHLRRRITQRG